MGQEVEAELPASLHDDQTDEQFATNHVEETMVALANAPPAFTPTLRHQLLRQLLTSDMWVLLKEPPRRPAGAAADAEEMEYRLLELDLAHTTRTTVPAFTSEARAEEAVETAGFGSVEGVAVPGLQLVQDFKKAGAVTDLMVNPFSRYGKRIAWEELEWLAANGRQLLQWTPTPREPTLRAVEITSSDLPPLPDHVESPVRDPFRAFVRPTTTPAAQST